MKRKDSQGDVSTSPAYRNGDPEIGVEQISAVVIQPEPRDTAAGNIHLNPVGCAVPHLAHEREGFAKTDNANARSPGLPLVFTVCHIKPRLLRIGKQGLEDMPAWKEDNRPFVTLLQWGFK
jgi:hypothetical protein